METFTPLPSAPVTGGKRHHKLKLVTKKQARKLLKKLGKKLRGGGDPAAPVVVPKDMADAAAGTASGGKRTRKRSASHRSASRKSLFGL